MNKANTVQLLKERHPKAIFKEIDFLNEKTLEIHKEHLRDVLFFLKQTPDPGYEVLMDLTGVDYLEPKKHTKVVYWLHNPSSMERIRVAIYVERNETIPSVIDIWEGADWYERELFDMLGISFEGHPDLKRILLPEHWKGHPLRRDYALTEEPVEFKHGVKPKTPSHIISYAKSQEKA